MLNVKLLSVDCEKYFYFFKPKCSANTPVFLLYMKEYFQLCFSASGFALTKLNKSAILFLMSGQTVNPKRA